jgi:UDP-glucose 4-epimerase
MRKDWDNMKVCVTGGAGYIGAHQVRMLLDLGYEVVVFDNLSTGFVEAIDKRAIFEEVDLRDTKKLTELLKRHQVDGIIHFAALSIVPDSMEQPLEYYDNNVYGMQSLLEAMKENKVKNIVFSSSAAVYGAPKKMPIDEDALTDPINPYGETKIAMEKMVKWAHEAYGINYVILRYFNVAGASLDGILGENHQPETHLIPIIMEVVFKKLDYLPVFGDDYNTPDGTCIRDYIHVLDLCDAHIKAFDYLLKDRESTIFNLGYNHGFSVMEIIEATNRITKEKLPYQIKPRRLGDPDELVASNEKIIKVLEWKPQYDDIDCIIRTGYDYYKKHHHQ